MNRDLIVFGEDWGGLPSSSQHLVRHLAETRKVVWINSIGLRRPRFNRGDLQRAWNKLRGEASPSMHSATPKNLHIVQPRTLPVPRGELERRLASSLLQRQIMPVVERASLNKPILWASLPTAVDMAGRFDESALVYYCGDDFSALAGVDHRVVVQRERELVERSDLIMAASEVLANRFPAETTQVLPHGVDFELFSTPSQRAADLPDDGRPIAGFYGSLSEWLDRSLLMQVIRQLPEWHFVFIGKADIDMSDLQRLHNVTLLGPRPHHKLPGYSQHWDVSLLPFVDNPQIRACNPLKLREYLATGRPVVSTEFPAALTYQGLVQVVSSAEEMTRAIRSSRYDSDAGNRQAAVTGHTWQARAEQVSRWLAVL
ncbi:MAG: glycosyltransferase [Sedimenticola sp.]